MKALISTDALLRATQIAQGPIHASSMPVLGHLLVEARNDRIYFTGTDLDLTVKTSVVAQIEREGAMTVPAKKLAAIAQSLYAHNPAGELELAAEGKPRLIIEAGKANSNSHFELIGLKASEFPPSTKLDKQKSLTIDQSCLKRLLVQTGFCMCQDESRYVLNGTRFESRDGLLRSISTDGRRLATSISAIDCGAVGDFVLPSRSVIELLRLIGESGQAVLQWTEKDISFNLGDTEIISKLIDGNYPNWSQVVPTEFAFKVNMRREPLLRALICVNLMCSNANNCVQFFLEPGVLRLQTGEGGENGLADIPCDYNGDPFHIAFSPQYLIDGLQVMTGQLVQLRFADRLSPCLIQGDLWDYVVMPMRTIETAIKRKAA